jgi:hypothetical protein
MSGAESAGSGSTPEEDRRVVHEKNGQPRGDDRFGGKWEEAGHVKKRITGNAGLLVAVIFLLNGCLPGMVISQKEPTAQGHPVEFRLGNPVEVGEWISLQKQVCGDLDWATEGLPENARKNIYKYSCVEPNRHALGETLSRLEPGQIDDLCAKLSQKGYLVTKDRIPKPAGELGTAFLLLIGSMALVAALAGGM